MLGGPDDLLNRRAPGRAREVAAVIARALRRVFPLAAKAVHHLAFHRRVDDRQGAHGAEHERQQRERADLQGRALVLVEADHDFAQDEYQGRVDDKRELEAMLAKILH